MSELHRADDLIEIFNSLFLKTLNTELVAGDQEPVYLPASADYPHHRIVFAHGYFASALHEISHWCVAGPERRQVEDFGYWYKPDGRTFDEQAEFERVEIKPQAYEWILSISAGKHFHFSADNLASGLGASPYFKSQVLSCVEDRLNTGMDSRLKALSDRLRAFYQRPELAIDQFSLADEYACAG